MFPYEIQIYIFSYLDAETIQNVTMTSSSAYAIKSKIIKDIWIERYPELIPYGKFEHNIFDMFYLDMVWDYLETYDLSAILARLNLNTAHEKPVAVTQIDSYKQWKSTIDRLAIFHGKFERTYDKLYTILSSIITPHEEDDPEEYEMLIHGLMEYGHATYKEILQSPDPYDTITDDMFEARSIGLVLEAEVRDDNYYHSGNDDHGATMDDIDDDLIANDQYMNEEYAEELIAEKKMEHEDFDDFLCDLECDHVYTSKLEDEHDDAIYELECVTNDMDPREVIRNVLLSDIHGDNQELWSYMIDALMTSADNMMTDKILRLTKHMKKL